MRLPTASRQPLTSLTPHWFHVHEILILTPQHALARCMFKMTLAQFIICMSSTRAHCMLGVIVTGRVLSVCCGVSRRRPFFQRCQGHGLYIIIIRQFVPRTFVLCCCWWSSDSSNRGMSKQYPLMLLGYDIVHSMLHLCIVIAKHDVLFHYVIV